MPSQPSLKITLVKSTIGQKQNQKDTARALGLRKMNQTVIRPDNPQMRGMVFTIQHLVRVEEVEAEVEAARRRPRRPEGNREVKLHDLAPPPGAHRKRRRIGRGLGSGRGTTAGKGTKGQKARAGGGVSPYFEGGQLPLVKKLPYRRGFTNINRVEYQPVNLADLKAFEAGATVGPGGADRRRPAQERARAGQDPRDRRA